ncbi:hypothetical protein [Geodermatophilus chilensis]|uniref:hypothetical protein n=1 Tax=Geodermatophilus chilensis TaxID=2035835 RepID=UPI0013001342|nr:hypothetical protein [Geodermatophilus chilensis]
MISTMWTLAPAGARGPVGLAVRTAACVESPVAARLRAVPATPVAQRPGTRVPGLDLIGTGVSVAPAIGVFGTAGLFGTAGYAGQTAKRTTEHNGTTLGIHSSGRPSS